MKHTKFSTVLMLVIGSLFLSGLNSCQQKKQWTQQEKDAWLTSCNAKFMKDGVEPKELKRFCNCALEQMQRDYTFDQVKDETIPANKQRDYFNTCNYNW